MYLQDDDVIGALNLYAQKPNAFDDTDRSTLAILSTHSGPAFTLAADRQAKDNLTLALTPNRKIGAAIGILMNKHRLTAASIRRPADRQPAQPPKADRHRFRGRRHRPTCPARWATPLDADCLTRSTTNMARSAA